MSSVSCTIDELRTKQTAQPTITPIVISKSSSIQSSTIVVATVSSSVGWKTG